MTPGVPYLLLVDDDADDRNLLVEAVDLQQPPIPMQHVKDGEELLNYLENCSDNQLPTVILMDYQMPGINGREALELLQANSRYKHLVKVMWSTSQRTKDMDDCKRLGAAAYLVKPSSDSEFRKISHQLLAIFDFASRSGQ